MPSAVGFKNFDFAADGRVRMASGGGAAGETVAANGKEGTTARDRLEGWPFTHADGRSELPDGNRGISVGGTTPAARP